MKPKVNVLIEQNLPIFSQLQLEEALLRVSTKNYCIINQGSSPAVVMGISGVKDELVETQCSIPVIKRFSGGGCVVVDENTFFFTLIGTPEISVEPYPEPILEYTKNLLKPMFPGIDYKLCAQDFVIENRKVGGNALYLRKDRWLIHTSFLWDYNKDLMAILKMPKKVPAYRKDRSHTEFVGTLKPYFKDKEEWKEKCLACLEASYDTHLTTLEALTPIKYQEHRKANQFV